MYANAIDHYDLGALCGSENKTDSPTSGSYRSVPPEFFDVPSTRGVRFPGYIAALWVCSQ